MAARITAILFDLGDTLLDFGKVDIPSMFEAGARLSYDYIKTMGKPLLPFARYHRRQFWAIRWNYLKSRISRREFNTLDILGRLTARMGHMLTAEQTQELAWLWYQPLSQCAKVENGLQDMLRGFRDSGISMGVVSNTFVPATALDRHLKQENLLDFFPVRVYSCDVRYRKPDPNIFRIAIQRIGRPAGEIIFVGDSPHADIAGANRAGMISVLKDPNGLHGGAEPPAAHTIRKLAQLREIVASYNR